MRILVTGGAGFIGSHTVDALLARGYEVRILDSLEPPVHTQQRPAWLAAEAELIRGSVLDRAVFRRALEQVDVVLHLAAYQDYLPDFSHFYETNTVGTALLYELIVNERLNVARVVIASSQAVYGEGKYRCAEHGVLYPGQRSSAQLEAGDWAVRCPTCARALDVEWTDEAAVHPHNCYAMSKRAQEELALALGQRYGIPTIGMRYSIVQGPRQSLRNAYSGALRSFTVRALAGQPPVMYEDGEQLRDFVSIQDVVRANLLALEDPRSDYLVLNVGSARRVSVRELAHMVVQQTGTSLYPEVPGLYRMGDTRHILSDVSLLTGLGWRPQVAQRDMVRDYVVWASNEPGLQDTFAPAQAHMQALGVLRGVASG